MRAIIFGELDIILKMRFLYTLMLKILETYICQTAEYDPWLTGWHFYWAFRGFQWKEHLAFRWIFSMSLYSEKYSGYLMNLAQKWLYLRNNKSYWRSSGAKETRGKCCCGDRRGTFKWDFHPLRVSLHPREVVHWNASEILIPKHIWKSMIACS